MGRQARHRRERLAIREARRRGEAPTSRCSLGRQRREERAMAQYARGEMGREARVTREEAAVQEHMFRVRCEQEGVCHECGTILVVRHNYTVCTTCCITR
jgi:hypothetical protein